MKILVPLTVSVLSLGIAGCATRKYVRAPISPIETASAFQSRTLEDPQLREFIEKSLGHELDTWPQKTWDLSGLMEAAFYFNPQNEISAARVAAANAAITTAGARPNPTLSVSPGIPSPYLFGLDFAVPIETAGKRGLRVEQAESLGESARLSMAETNWKIYVGVRGALLNYEIAARRLDLSRSQARLLSERVKLLERRLLVGEIPRPDVDFARISLSNAQLALRSVEGRVAETKAALAAAIGIPLSGFEGVEFSWPGLGQPPADESLSAARIQREAVLNRLDVRRALANYAAAESALKLEIAKQYPDLQIGPGYQYEESHNFFTLGVSLTLPVFNRNQGPIAEAEARRKEVAATFLASQARVIAESETALAAYRASLQQLSEANQSLMTTQMQREEMSRRALQAGESDQLTLSGVLLEGSNAAMARLDALERAQTALGALEDALQRPLAPNELPTRAPAPRNKPLKGAKP